MEETPPPPQSTAPTTGPPPAEKAASTPTEPPSEPPPSSSSTSTSTSTAAIASSPSPSPAQNPQTPTPNPIPTQTQTQTQTQIQTLTQTPSQVLQSQQRPSIAGNRPPQSSSLSSTSPFSSFGPSRSSVQPFSPLSATQARQSIQGLQKIGTSSFIGGSQMRPSGVFGHQTLGQSSLRATIPSTSQSLSSQKFHGHILSRPPSMASPSSPSTFSPSRPQSLQQPLASTQGKQMASSLASSSYRPQVRPPAMQQRPHIQQHQHSLPTSSHQQQISSSQQQQQQQKHQQLQMHQRLQQQQQASPSQQSQDSRQQYLPHKNQQSVPQQQSGRTQVSTAQNPTIPAVTQSGVVQSGVITSNKYDAAESGNHIINKRSIRELVTQIDPSEKLDPEVEDVLVEIGDDFIESITMFACSLAKHRKSTMLEAKDILQHVERNWNMTLPGFGGEEIKCYKKQLTNDIHRERLAVIKKSMVGTNETANIKNGPAAQAASNPKAHAAKAPAPGSPK